MIPVPFEYAHPDSIDEAISLLEENGDDAKILAGGHSLLPLMKLRLAAPAILVDLAHVPGLDSIRSENGDLVIGAMTRYVDLQDSADVLQYAPLLAQAAGLVGDAQVRNRGTLGGALAHADPAGDMPAIAQALGASIQTVSPRGTRTIPADEFFQDIFTPDIEADEIVVSIRVPKRQTGGGQHYEKFRRRLCDWAIVGAAVNIQQAPGDGPSVRVVLSNVASTPVHAIATEQALDGGELSQAAIEQASNLAAEGLEPTPELNAPTEYKQHLARVITRRALEKALAS